MKEMIKLRISFLPKSRLGIWSSRLNIFTLSVFIFFYIFAELLGVITTDILITVFGFSAVIASIIAFFIGIVAVIKNEERSFMVYLAILMGFVVLAFIIGDILGFPDI
jgi:hypothetical protein